MKSVVKWVAWILAVIGALNWGLVGAFQFDLVASLLGGMESMASRVVYSLVGLSAVVLIVFKIMKYSGKRR